MKSKKEKLKLLGAISHEEHKDKHYGKVGTPRRDKYEKELKEEMEKGKLI